VGDVADSGASILIRDIIFFAEIMQRSRSGWDSGEQGYCGKGGGGFGVADGAA
jgi:hypothetical protein